MFLPTPHVHRLIASASVALLVMLSTPSARAIAQSQIADVPELAFVSNGQIFHVRLDGTEPAQLTHDGVNSEPAWSPDGSRIAFVHSDGSSGGSQIYVMNADGSNVVQRTNAGGASPAWSPDGTRMAFSSLRDGQYRIYVMRVDEDWWNPAPLGFDRGWNGQPAWSPDGTKIAFTNPNPGISTIGPDGRGLKEIIKRTNTLTFDRPFWSPTGSHIVCYGFATTGDTDLFRGTSSGASLTNLTNTPSTAEISMGWR